MAKAVGQALARLEPLIVEAGTGTGKTFAYLVPALLSGRSVIISTGTRTLQDQLFRRDVPLLARALGLPAKIALLKGRAELFMPASVGTRDPAGILAWGRARCGAHASASFAVGGDDEGRRSVRTHRPTRTIAGVAPDHLDPRKLLRNGVPPILAPACVRGAAQRAGGRYRRSESPLIARRSRAQGRGLRRSSCRVRRPSSWMKRTRCRISRRSSSGKPGRFARYNC